MASASQSSREIVRRRGGLRMTGLQILLSIEALNSISEQRMVDDRQNPNWIGAGAHRGIRHLFPTGSTGARCFDFAYATPAGIVSSTSVLESSSLHTASLPPMSLQRSCMPGRP